MQATGARSNLLHGEAHRVSFIPELEIAASHTTPSAPEPLRAVGEAAPEN
jgi:hypothetical protein